MQAWNISSTIKQGNWCLAHKHLGLNSNILMKSMFGTNMWGLPQFLCLDSIGSLS